MSHLATVSIAVSCRHLPKLYPNIDAVSCVYASVQQAPDKPWESTGRTEVLIDEANPDFHHIFEVEYSSRRHQHLKFDIWDVSDKTGSILRGATLLGSVEISLVRIVRLRGQPISTLILDAKGNTIGKNATFVARAVAIRREKDAPVAPPPPPPAVRFNFRRVREWRFNAEDRFSDWVDIPREEQTEANKCKGWVELPVEHGETRVSDLMALVLAAAGMEPDPVIKLKAQDFEDKKAAAASAAEAETSRGEQRRRRKVDKRLAKMRKERQRKQQQRASVGDNNNDNDDDDDDDDDDDNGGGKKKKAPRGFDDSDDDGGNTGAGGNGSDSDDDDSDASSSDPDGDDSDDEDEATRLRRKRKEEEMTVKERMLLKVHNRNVLQAYLSTTANFTTKQIRVQSLHERDFDPTLLFLRDEHMFAGGPASRAMTTLHSHGFVVWPAPSPANVHAHASLLSAMRATRDAEADAARTGRGIDWGLVTDTCRHCQAVVHKDS